MIATFEGLLADMTRQGRPHTQAEREAEAKHVMDLLADPNIAKELADYGAATVAGVGGSGIILSATHATSQTERAIKLPRLPIYKKALDGESVEVDPELAALAKISHQNITRLYASFKIPRTDLHGVITQYVPEHASLDEYAFALCCNDRCRTSKRELRAALRTLTGVVLSIVEAVDYMHSIARLLHFDLKPDNILVTPDGIPFVTDLGFAREIKEYGETEQVWVGFTWKYAHPRLTKPHDGARVSRVAEKSKMPLPARELNGKYDVFAFGRTLQQMLQRLNQEYGEQVQSVYEFNYLHLVASLCLDGVNSRTEDEEDFISDFAMSLPSALFTRNRFTSFAEIKHCLARLTGQRRLEDDLPEVDRWYGSTIKVSDVGATTLTSRLEATINHPALQRLKREKQLGMLDNIFPTANHTRFQHTLGTYHAVTQYIAALYYDPDNPVFRALFDQEQCATALVGALSHDLGQTAYGHELEEVDKDEFDHEKFVAPIMESTAFVDSAGRTLKALIEGGGDSGWSVRASRVLQFLKGSDLAAHSLGQILHDMLDSQIDADKFDYLIRDSVESRVSYGHGIDHERFLHSLTTHVDSTGSLRLAIKQKGAASAEAFIYARYQLYQSLYWHHTFRATKAMLLEGVRLILEELQAVDGVLLADQRLLRDEYAKHVIGIELKPGDATKRKKPADSGAREIISARLKENAKAVLPSPYETDLTMKFLWSIADGKSRALMDDLIARRYYKRIFEVSPAQLNDARWRRLHKRFQSRAERQEIQEALNSKLYDTIRGALQSRSDIVTSLQVDGVLSKFEAMATDKCLFVIDIPLRGWYAAEDAPHYVSDYKRRHFRANAAGGVERREEFWIETMGEMMEDIAFVRVFCAPEAHGLITRVLKAKSITDAIQAAIPELKVGD